MSNPLVKGQANQQQTPDLNKLYHQFQQNPMKYLSGMGIPQGMNDPKQILAFLADNGKIPPALKRRANAMLGRK